MGFSWTQGMACFSKASPALMELLDKLHSMETPRDMDHHLYEFGSIRYHIQASASDSKNIYLSVSTPILSPDISHSRDLQGFTLQEIRSAYSYLMEVVERPKEGFILTLKLDLAKLPPRRGREFLNENLAWKPEKFTVIFPMCFKEESDVVIATSFFQELMEVSYSSACAKAPTCTWSPIPPAELRGESLQSLSTNGGFVSFDIYSHHVKGAKVEKTIWILLNFYTFVKYHVKCTRGFIQRKMRQRLEGLSEVLQKARVGEDEDYRKAQGCRSAKKLLSISKARMLRRTCGALTKHIRRICHPIKVKVLARFRRRHRHHHHRWLRIPKFSSLRKSTKLD